MDKLPVLESLAWYGTKVPGDIRGQKPAFDAIHRYLFRTHAVMPGSVNGGGVFLEFQCFRTIASVFVNGQYCGGSRNFNSVWSCDITKAVKPGQSNEIIVAIKDGYYGIDPKRINNKAAESQGARAAFNLPEDMLSGNQAGGQLLDIHVGYAAGLKTGIFEPLTLVATGPAYTEDVFAKPSVKNKTLGLEITLVNPGPTASLTMENEICPWVKDAAPGAPEKTFASKTVQLAAGETKTLEINEAWANPKLWWPDDPNLYVAVTRIKKDGKLLDTRQTRFGFREWGWDKPYFTLNGARWHFWAGIRMGKSPQQFLEICRETNQNLMRFWNNEGWGGMTKRQVLDFMDEKGIAVRNSLPFDGQIANYGPGLSEPTADGKGRTYRKALFSAVVEQGRAELRSWRNHPSILIWSLENEIAFINSLNLGQAAHVEPGLRWAAAEVIKMDPTRSIMVDGGNALRPPEEWKNADELKALGQMPVNGGHYLETGVAGMNLRDYPDASYSNEIWVKNKQRDAWYVLPDRPLFHGEIFFGNGYSPEKLAELGGEESLQGRAQTGSARAFFMRMMSEGYRWSDSSAAYHFWDEMFESKGIRDSWAPAAVLCREWNWTFGSGAEVKRTLLVHNQTSKNSPLEFEWIFSVAGKSLAGKKQSIKLEPGERSEPMIITFTTPKLDVRTPAEFTTILRRDGKELFRKSETVAILSPATVAPIKPGSLAVFDPSGESKTRLTQLGIAFTAVDSVDALKTSQAQILLIGRDAVPENRAADPFWMGLAASGKRLIVLEQQQPLRYQAVPADFDISSYRGRIAYPEDLTHPVFAGLDTQDFRCWSGDHTSYKSPYRKPTSGARSLLQCDDRLNYTALAEAKVGTGLMIFCQALVGEKLASDAVAQTLFSNLLSRAAGYQALGKEVAAVLPADSKLKTLMTQLRVNTSSATDPLSAIGGKTSIAVVEASAANLATLAGAKAQVDAFTSKGGWLVLRGLEPDGLTSFNTLVGVQHLIRPCTLERTGITLPRTPIAAGLSLRDIVMNSGEKVAPWMGLLWMADDVFTNVVDTGNDIAPFCNLDGQGPKAQAAKAPEVRNVVNGFTAEEFWKYIYYIDMTDGRAPRLVIDLPRPETVTGMEINLDKGYRIPHKLKLTFDSETTATEFACEADGSTQTFKIPPRKVSKLVLDLDDLTPGEKNITGIDNMRLFIQRDETFIQKVKPLTEPGGIVSYPNGKGGIVLFQLNIKERESNPANVDKKANITKVLFENLGADFGGKSAVVAGATNLRYFPVKPKEQQFTAFTTFQGQPSWLRDNRAKDTDLSQMPVGEQRLAGVTYYLNDFSTSPVPTVIMLAGAGSTTKQTEMPGIAVGAKADALFFLHTFGAADPARRYDPEKRREQDPDPVVLRYRVNYADGKSVEIPVIYKAGIDDWLQSKPLALKSAAVAWSAPAKGNPSLQTTLYSMQWNNSRPEIEIKSIDILPGTIKDVQNWGAPVTLAITAATTEGK